MAKSWRLCRPPSVRLLPRCVLHVLSGCANVCMCSATQLRIGAIVRRDSEAEHPHFPGAARPPILIVLLFETTKRSVEVLGKLRHCAACPAWHVRRASPTHGACQPAAPAQAGNRTRRAWWARRRWPSPRAGSLMRLCASTSTTDPGPSCSWLKKPCASRSASSWQNWPGWNVRMRGVIPIRKRGTSLVL